MLQAARNHSSWRLAAVAGALAIFVGTMAWTYLGHYPIPFRAKISVYGCFLLQLLMALAPGIKITRTAIHNWMSRYDATSFLPIWCLPYFVYCAGTHDFRWTSFLRLVAIAGLVLLLYRVFPVRNPNRLCWQDGAVAGWLIAIVLSHAISGVWLVPVNLDFMGRLFLIAVASWCWIFVRPVPKLGYEFEVTGKAVKAAGVNFAWFALIAIPSGLALRFTAWNPRWRGFVTFGAEYLEIFLFIALLEELFFRGFLQNLISNSFESWKWGQSIVSCLFGLFHILHAPFPNWRYVALATVAGWFYGSAFRQGRSLMASSLVHATVDTVWRTWLTRTG
jgi:uncharacterized protein